MTPQQIQERIEEYLDNAAPQELAEFMFYHGDLDLRQQSKDLVAHASNAELEYIADCLGLLDDDDEEEDAE